MKQILTKDGSFTLHSEKYDETYHSVSGAVEEAFEKFVKPCRIAEIKNPRVLDICFGLGYNSAAAVSLNQDIEIVGLENDEKLFDEIQKLEPELKYYDAVKKLVNNPSLEYAEDKIKIKLVMGDARETIKKLNGKFDAAFLDGFSPKKCPELWTYEFFSDIIKLMKPGAILATYSCARVVRENLKRAGFIVKNGPAVGRRAPSTIAIAPVVQSGQNTAPRLIK